MIERAGKQRGGGIVDDERDAELTPRGGNLRQRWDNSFGLGKVSTYQARVRSSEAAAKAPGSLGSTKRVSIPMSRSVLAKRL